MTSGTSRSHSAVPQSRRQRNREQQQQDITNNRASRRQRRQHQRSRQLSSQRVALLPSGSIATQRPGMITNNGATSFCLRLASSEQWNVDELPIGAQEIVFGKDFKVKNSHILGIVTASSDFRANLLKISCADATSITDAAISQLALGCRSLEALVLTSAVKLTDVSVLALLTKCRKLHTLAITGSSTVLGNVKGSFLGELPGIPKRIHTFDFTNQQVDLTELTGYIANGNHNLSISVGYRVDNTVRGESGTEIVRQDEEVGDNSSTWGLPGFDNFYTSFRETLLDNILGNSGNEAFIDDAENVWYNVQTHASGSSDQAVKSQEVQALLT